MISNVTDVVFVTPSFQPTLHHESIGTLILAKKAQIANHTVKIVRFWESYIDSYSIFIDQICKKIIAYNPLIVSFYCRAAEYHIILDIAQRVKRTNQKVKIIFGGPQAEVAAKSTMQHFEYVDYICCGEGENTITPLLDILINHNTKVSLKEIPGLVHRYDEKICCNELPSLLPDNYTNQSLYYDLVPNEVIAKSNTITIDVGRGCPFSCSFCSTKSFWKQKYRLRDIHDTLREISYVLKNFGNKTFSFNHDLFTADKKRIIDFCRKLKESKTNIKWTCSSRIDCIDAELIDIMVSAGLVGIYFGIETGSERMQKLINKNLNIEHCIEIVQYSVSKGIRVTTSFIYGFPQETYEDLECTLGIIQKILLQGADVQLHYLSFDQGSEMYKTYFNQLVCTENYNINKFGVSELFSLIQTHPDIFATYWDYPSNIRNEMKFLQVLHSLGREYPQIYTEINKFLHDKGMSYVDISQLLYQMIVDSVKRFIAANVKLSKSTSYFLIEKMITKLLKNIDNITSAEKIYLEGLVKLLN